MARVLVQAGHNVPRHPGIPGVGTGGEAELVHAIQHELLELFEDDERIEGLHYHGDLSNAPKEKELDLALFLHADGSINPDVSGYSFGFPAGDSLPVNKPFTDKIAAEFEQIGHPGSRRNDNYTPALGGYYGFRYTPARGAECVIEHGFLTNTVAPFERRWLFAHVEDLARAEYIAVQRELHFEVRDPDVPPADGPPPGPVPVPRWFWYWMRWLDGHAEYRRCGPRFNPARCSTDAPLQIPQWARERRQWMLERRKPT